MKNMVDFTEDDVCASMLRLCEEYKRITGQPELPFITYAWISGLVDDKERIDFELGVHVYVAASGVINVKMYSDHDSLVFMIPSRMNGLVDASICKTCSNTRCKEHISDIVFSNLDFGGASNLMRLYAKINREIE